MIANEYPVTSIEIPKNKIGLIKNTWVEIYTAIVENGKIQIKLNMKRKRVDLRACESTIDHGYINRSMEFLKAIIEGFKIEDATAILRYRDIFLDTFEISEVRKMKTNHLTRAIGRIVGRSGKTKDAIESYSRSKFLLLDQRIVLLGSVESTNIAKDAIGRLIQGAEPKNIYTRLLATSTKLKNKYGSLKTIYEDLRDEE